MRALIPLAFLAIVGCAGDTDTDTKTDTDTDTDTAVTDNSGTTGTSGDTGKKVELFDLTAAIVDPSTGAAVTEPLCGELLEISEVVLDPKNGKLTVLATATSDKGSITFEDIDVKPAIPMLINLDDCAKSKADVVGISSNTGVLPASYADAKNGATVTTTAFIISPTYLAGLQASLVGIGDKTTNLAKDGWLHGLALDEAGSPLAGVTVTCKACKGVPTYYVDGDAKVGGLLAGAGGLNASTQTGVAQWMVPAAPVSNYSATDTAKTPVTFAPQLGGSFPGSVIVTAFIAEPAAK